MHLIIGNHDVPRLEALRPYFSSVQENLRLNIQGIDCYLVHEPSKGRPDRFNLVGHIHSLWKVRRNMVNVGCDAWHFLSVSEEEIKRIYDAIQNHYDENVFLDGKP